MPYAELIQALDREVGRQIEEGRAAAQVERLRLLEEARATARAELETAARVERERAAARRAAAVARARSEHQGALLIEKRRLLAELRARVLDRLARSTIHLPALLGEALEGLSPAPVEVTVDPGQAEAARQFLAEQSGRGAEAAVDEAGSARGGVEVRCGRTVHDNTWAARLERAWPELEGPVAAVLFGGGDGAL